MRGYRMLAAVIVLAACGDAETNDSRGYTKAPLEHPTVMIRSEEPDAMREFGEPNLPRPVVLEDTTSTAE